jgi:uracil-DNA glycosylase
MTVRPQISGQPGGILFLADAPGAEDDIKGRPLVGGEGFLLARALRMASLTDPSAVPSEFEPSLLGETRRLLWERRAHSFAYVLPEQPPRNADLKALRALYTDQVDEDLGVLLHLTRPNVVVTMGDLALWSVTNETSSEQWRGAPRSGSFGLKVLPTYPLDRVQQSYKLLGPLVADLMKVRHEAQFPEVRPTEVALWLEPDLGDLARFRRNHIDTSDLLTVDIETSLGQVVCIQFGTSGTTGIVVPFVDYRKSNRSYWETEAQELAALIWVRDVLDCPIPKLMQNGQYDTIWLLDRLGMTVRNYRHDLRLMHHILQPELPKSLAFLGSLYTGMPRWKTKVQHGSQTDKRRDDA